MGIEHCDFLSWLSRRGDGHEQDGETFSRAVVPQPAKTSGDPAMAFVPPLRRTGAGLFKSMTAAGSNVGGSIAAGETTD
jgi:hypothetical protein